jgi:excisionase family DNA binding protein
MEKLLSVNELSKYLGVPKSWIYSRTREVGPGAIPRLMVGKYIKFRLSEVMAWLEEKQNVAWKDKGI